MVPTRVVEDTQRDCWWGDPITPEEKTAFDDADRVYQALSNVLTSLGGADQYYGALAALDGESVTDVIDTYLSENPD